MLNLPRSKHPKLDSNCFPYIRRGDITHERRTLVDEAISAEGLYEMEIIKYIQVVNFTVFVVVKGELFSEVEP